MRWPSGRPYRFRALTISSPGADYAAGVRVVGRRRELAVIENWLDRAAAGAGGLLTIGGPSGSGKTALVDAAVVVARSRGLPVVRGLPEPAFSGLVVLDDVTVPAAQVERLVVGGAAVLVTSTSDPAPSLNLGPLSQADLERMLTGHPVEVVHAVWLATGGWPGPSLDLVAAISSQNDDPVAEVALQAKSHAEFLAPDAGIVRLLDSVASRSLSAATRARVLIRLARELLGDPSAEERRHDLADEAARLAGATGDAGVMAEVLDGRLNALWSSAGAERRLATASEIVDLARKAGNAEYELRGLLWRYTAFAELGDLTAAETALATYMRLGELVGQVEVPVVVKSRQAMLAMVRGRFDLAASLADEAAVAGQRAGLVDTVRLTTMVNGFLALWRGEAGEQVATLQELARRLPGQFYEATTARVLAEAGQLDEAALELDRLLSTVLAGSGPRWLGAVADLAFVAARGTDLDAAQRLFDTLSPYRGRLVVWGRANMITGTVYFYLGALAQRLGRPDEALTLLDQAVEQEERLGALPWLTSTLALRQRPGDDERLQGIAARLGIGVESTGQVWRMIRDGDDWILEARSERARLRDVRGLHYLRTLVSAPGQEIAALDLVAGGAGLRTSLAEPNLDAQARSAYKQRLKLLDEQLDAADRVGDVERAELVSAERNALTTELRRAAGAAGRPGRPSAEAERARVNATRALSVVVRRLEVSAPLAAAHLKESLRTGMRFRYQPAPDGPRRWQV